LSFDSEDLLINKLYLNQNIKYVGLQVMSPAIFHSNYKL